MRAGGAGIAGFFTKTGVGTPVAEGKAHEDFDGETFILERGLVTDVSLVKAHTADLVGNLRYRYTAANFNPLVATCGKITIVEAEVILPEGEYIDPNFVTTPGIFVQRLVHGLNREKDIEQRTTRERPRGSEVSS
jgi:3-oxoacid CoA-transferase subunit A